MGIYNFICIGQEVKIYGESGYYINPLIIQMALRKNLKLPFDEKKLILFIKTASLYITSYDIKKWAFDKLCKIYSEKGYIDNVEDYNFDENILFLFHDYILKIKNKCLKLITIKEKLEEIKFSLDFSDLSLIEENNININGSGNIYYKDAIKLLYELENNINELYEFVLYANDPKNYYKIMENEYVRSRFSKK